MQRILASATLLLALLAGCSPPANHAMHDLGVDFRDAFLRELSSRGDYLETSTTAGGSSTTFSSALTFEVKGPAARSLDVFALGQGVRNAWGKHMGFSSNGVGGGGSLFTMEFGDDGEYAFIDVIGHPTEEGMSFVFLVRAIG